MKVYEYKYRVTDATPSEYFYVKDGPVVKNLVELAKALKEMKPTVFEYHNNRNKNDFSEWVRNCIKDVVLADKMARIVMKDKTEILVLRRLFELSEKSQEMDC
ncbi:hypothetical protein FJZ53_04270 [Candidatus Woesearchaeota archaeon]|nr:hypothetical protein [Candidatus Woesearchaeota archaeon]